MSSWFIEGRIPALEVPLMGEVPIETPHWVVFLKVSLIESVFTQPK